MAVQGNVPVEHGEKISTVRIKCRNRIPRKAVKSLFLERFLKDSLGAGCWISCSLELPTQVPITGKYFQISVQIRVKVDFTSF